jgi:hypothetical protein
VRLDDLVLSYSQLRDAAGLFLAVTLIAAGRLLPSGLGLMHARRVSPAVEILSGHPDHAPTPVTARWPAGAWPARTRREGW